MKQKKFLGGTYSGYNTVVRNRASGVSMEVQYHTPQSFSLTQRGHLIYEKSRVLPEGDPRRVRMEEEMRTTWSVFKAPPGWERLPGRDMAARESAPAPKPKEPTSPAVDLSAIAPEESDRVSKTIARLTERGYNLPEGLTVRSWAGARPDVEGHGKVTMEDGKVVVHLAPGASEHAVWHELGHASHPNAGYREGAWAQDIRFNEERAALIRKHVSSYAATDGAEFVAEVYAHAAAGKEFPPEIWAIYDQLEGPDLPGRQRAGKGL